MNQVIYVLTMITTVVLPAQFLTGVFGMCVLCSFIFCFMVVTPGYRGLRGVCVLDRYGVKA